MKRTLTGKRTRSFQVFWNVDFPHFGLLALLTFTWLSRASAAPTESPDLAPLADRVAQMIHQAAAGAPVPAVTGPDSMVFWYYDSDSQEFNLGRRETARSDQDNGSILATNVSGERAAVTGDGAVALFVTPDNDLAVVGTADFNTRQSLGVPGRIQSVAVSPDGRRAALGLHDSAKGQPAPLIALLDLVARKAYLFGMTPPAVAGAVVDSVLYPDTMTFSADGTTLVYDAVTQLRFGAGPTVQRWSLYAINLVSGETSVLVPPKEGSESANPAFSRSGSRYLIYDVLQVDSGGVAVTVLDRTTGQAAVVATSSGDYAYPSFLGDESGFIYTAPDPDAPGTGNSLFKLGLQPDRLHPQGDATLWYRDADYGVVYRRAASQAPNTSPTVSLSISADTIPTGGTVTLTATASDADGTIARVEFYDDSTRLAQVESAPYVFVWKNVPGGNHLLTARAVDNLGADTTSSPRFLTVSGGPAPGGDRPRLTIKPVNRDTVRLAVTAPAGYYIIAMSEDLDTWVDIYPLTLDTSGHGELDDSGGPLHSRRLFYRVRRDP